MYNYSIDICIYIRYMYINLQKNSLFNLKKLKENKLYFLRTL